MGSPGDPPVEADLSVALKLSTGCVAAGNKYPHIYLRLRVIRSCVLHGRAEFNGADTDA